MVAFSILPNPSSELTSHHRRHRRRAQIAGLELRELNALEREFLFLLGFRLAVRREEYDACAASLSVPLACPSIPSSQPIPAPQVPHFQPALQCSLDPAGIAAARSTAAEEQPEPMDIVSGAGRLHIGDHGCRGSDGGVSDCCGERWGDVLHKYHDGPGPIAPSGPALLD
jgi:hypothetical protein